MKTVQPHSLVSKRLLTELVCLKEESDGYPASAVEADCRAIEVGGPFHERIMTRALSLPGAEQALQAVLRVRRIGRWVFLSLLLIAGLFGIAAASAALQQSATVSLPLVLLTLVGFNALSLLGWILFQFGGIRTGAILGAVWQKLTRRFSPDGAKSELAHRYDLSAVAELTTGRGARWRLGVMTHAAWLSYTAAGLIALTVLLVVGAHELTWQTTLLSAEGLRAWADTMSAAPRLFGASGPEFLPLNGELSADHRRGWAIWILLAVFSYGLIPRLLVLCICVALLLRAQARWGRDLSRPGFARLRARLMPERTPVQMIDEDASSSNEPPTVQVLVAKPLPEDGVHVVSVECVLDLPSQNRTKFQWLPPVEDAGSRDAAVARLRSSEVSALVIIVRATATPDRGLCRLLGALAAAADASSWLALADLDGLRSRGEGASAHRLRDWASAAQEAGILGGLLAWQGSDAVPMAELDVPG